jgi:hypothetical protein
MIDLDTFKAQSEAWGISLSVRFALESLTRPSLKPLEEFTEEDHEDFEFRGRVAEILIQAGLAKKAGRYIDCAREGYVLRCEGPDQHEFFSPLYCDLRFCPRCAPRRFARLFAKHSGTLDFIRRNPRRGYLLREITLTSVNTGELNSKQIKDFNLHVKKTLKILMKGIDDWGAIWVDEVGFNNTNLHAHILIYGPYIPQTKLAKLWCEVSGNQVAWIEQARVNGSKALLHLLKYVSKPPADDPNIVGLLEVAFHDTRRVHTVGLFYNFTGDDADGSASEWQSCPKCGAKLTADRKRKPISQLKNMGLEFIGQYKSKKERKAWVN